MGKTRDRLIAEMTLRRCRAETIRSYVGCCRRLVAHYWRPAETLTRDEVRDFVLHLVRERNIGPSQQKVYGAALRFLYTHVLHRPDVGTDLPSPRTPKTLPVVLSGTEVETLLQAIKAPTFRAVVMCMYGAGLRISEACTLRPENIVSERMVIHVVDAKGARDRFVTLSQRLLDELRAYWKAVHPPRDGFLFPGGNEGHLGARGVRQKLKRTAVKIGLGEQVTPHTLRHSYATHLLELGVDVRVVQALLGHSSIRTTVRYTQVGGALIARTKNPLDLLGTEDAKPLG